MAEDIDLESLIWIVTGVQLRAELGDRPLAYRIEKEIHALLAELVGPRPEGEPPLLAPAVISDVYYLNNQELQNRPVISIGGPGVNAVSAMLVNELPTAVAIENVLVVQMDLDFEDPRCAVWGMNHLETIQAVELFISKGYLRNLIKAVVAGQSEE